MQAGPKPDAEAGGTSSRLQPRASSVQNLPETPKRVEMLVSYSKQKAAYPSTRDSSRHGCSPIPERLTNADGTPVPPKRQFSNLEPLTSNFQNLMGTPERLETTVSYRKQSLRHPPNRYTSHPADFASVAPAIPNYCHAERARAPFKPSPRVGNLPGGSSLPAAGDALK